MSPSSQHHTALSWAIAQTCFYITTASTGTLRMTSSFTSLEDYLKHLHLFGETFALHKKTGTTVIVQIPQAIERLEEVFFFDTKCHAGASLIGTTAVTQGPQGTVSSVVMEDERRSLKSAWHQRPAMPTGPFQSKLATKFSIKSSNACCRKHIFRKEKWCNC